MQQCCRLWRQNIRIHYYVVLPIWGMLSENHSMLYVAQEGLDKLFCIVTGGFSDNHLYSKSTWCQCVRRTEVKAVGNISAQDKRSGVAPNVSLNSPWIYCKTSDRIYYNSQLYRENEPHLWLTNQIQTNQVGDIRSGVCVSNNCKLPRLSLQVRTSKHWALTILNPPLPAFWAKCSPLTCFTCGFLIQFQVWRGAAVKCSISLWGSLSNSSSEWGGSLPPCAVLAERQIKERLAECGEMSHSV